MILTVLPLSVSYYHCIVIGDIGPFLVSLSKSVCAFFSDTTDTFKTIVWNFDVS